MPGKRTTVDHGAMTSDAGMTSGRELKGSVALITGGGRNIGRAIALSLAAGGASVMVNVDRSRGDAEETVRLVEVGGGKAACFVADGHDREAHRLLAGAGDHRHGFRIGEQARDALLPVVPAEPGLDQVARHRGEHGGIPPVGQLQRDVLRVHRRILPRGGVRRRAGRRRPGR